MEIVRKRLAYHIWLKANKITIDTNLVNIHNSIVAFEGKTFAEVVMETTIENQGEVRVFNHFNRAWSMDHEAERWALSVKSNLVKEATNIVRNLKDNMFDKYGPEINIFFADERKHQTWDEIVKNNKTNQDDDDDWFDEEDDIDELVKQGLIEPSFIQFLQGKEEDNDKQSVASWGTGNTAYTELMDNQESVVTVNSALTQDSTALGTQDTQGKRQVVIDMLRASEVKESILEDISQNNHPYEFLGSP